MAGNKIVTKSVGDCCEKRHLVVDPRKIEQAGKTMDGMTAYLPWQTKLKMTQGMMDDGHAYICICGNNAGVQQFQREREGGGGGGVER